MPLSGFRALQRARSPRRARGSRRTRATPPPARSGRRIRRSPRERPLSIWIYGTGYREGVEFESQLGVAAVAARARLSASTRTPSGYESIEDGRRGLPRVGDAARVELDYEIDGIVIKVDSLDQQARLGALHERPRWARAFKWAPMTATTTPRKIHDPRRPHGRAQPVGAARAGRGRRRHRLARDAPQRGGHQPQGHPRGRPRRRPARRRRDPADRRAGRPAPSRERSRSGCRRSCPLCGADVVKPEGEVMHRCPNRACPSRGLETLINWVTAAMDIEGVGEQFVRRLWDARPRSARCRISTGSRRSSWSSSTATARSRRRTRSTAIEQSKAQPFSRVLFGLNIPEVGWIIAQNLARHFGTVDRLLAATHEELEEVEGIGPERAESIAEWFADEQNRALVAGAARARAPLRGRRGGAAGRGAAHRKPVRDHRHARELHARGGAGPRSRRSARRSRTPSRRRRPGSSSARARARS